MKSRVYTFLLAFAASLGSLSSGIFFTNLNASLSKVLSAIDALGSDSIYISFLSAVIPFGAIFGAVATSHNLDTIGRRRNIIIADILPIVGCALSIVPDFFAMFIGRFMCGVACGINFAVVPLYISEISSLSAERKGTPYSRLMFSFGMLLTFILALSTSNFADHWKVLFLLPILFSIIRLIVFGMFVKYDTASFYIANGREEDALKALKNLWLQDEIDIAYQQSNPRDNVAALSGILDYKYTKQAKIIMLLMFVAQFMGANVLLFHSTLIFAGRRDQNMTDYTSLEGQNLGLGIAMFAVTVFGSKLIERIRRRLSLVYGTLIMTGLCFLIAGSEAISFWFGETTLIIAYGALQALLFGVIMPAYCEDMLPVLSMSSIVLMEMILGMIAVAIAPFVGVNSLFIAFGIVGAVGFVPVFKKVKETKGKTKDEVMKMFHSTKENGLLDEEVAQIDTSMY